MLNEKKDGIECRVECVREKYKTLKSKAEKEREEKNIFYEEIAMLTCNAHYGQDPLKSGWAYGSPRARINELMKMCFHSLLCGKTSPASGSAQTALKKIVPLPPLRYHLNSQVPRFHMKYR